MSTNTTFAILKELIAAITIVSSCYYFIDHYTKVIFIDLCRYLCYVES